MEFHSSSNARFDNSKGRSIGKRRKRKGINFLNRNKLPYDWDYCKEEDNNWMKKRK